MRLKLRVEVRSIVLDVLEMSKTKTYIVRDIKTSADIISEVCSELTRSIGSSIDKLFCCQDKN